MAHTYMFGTSEGTFMKLANKVLKALKNSVSVGVCDFCLTVCDAGH